MLKKFVKTSVLIGAVVAALGVTTQVDAASCGTVTATSLYVRSGASTSHNILGTVNKGNTVEIKDTQDGWHKINYKGNDGWVSGKYISSSSNSSTSGSTSNGSTSTGTTQSSKTGTITANSLNVRSGAATSYSILGTLSNGKTVTIYGESNGWYKISYNGGYGWVSKTYVSTTGSTTSNGSTSTGTTNTTTTKTVAQIRSQIATTYAQAKALSGRTNFSQQCSLYVYSQLRALNIYQTPDTYWNGSQWFSKLTANGKTRTGYTQKKYAGVNCLTNLVNANGGKDVYNVVVTFPRSYRSTSTVGHVLFIHAIKDGKVYYSDNYAYNGQPEGSTIVKSVSEFTNYFSSNYSGITGAVHFVK
ncbi:MAG: SH3 domain-containing protein [Intestinibacter bartlettii]|uniref:SH3 domain-containing protein n=1 Tax=Intestinibacter bartlettii TaxID=261299 RepID=UPI0026ED7783|nr:SH3 domain-containing protein [Intestinibacter bartlettii]MDO5010492.1 SH3 domain-containing protein [Intestinibacter bartlettii]